MIREKLDRVLESLRGEMVGTLCALVERNSVSPQDGGPGELGKVRALEERIAALGLGETERHDVPDPMAPEGIRPNLLLRIPGRRAERLWFVTHTDVVPEGDRSLWSSDPFRGVLREGRVYGRGSGDNGQELVASLYAAAALKRLGIEPEYEIVLAFVADEERGSRFGIVPLIGKGLFRPSDLLVVPDGGEPSGDFIEIAEKSCLWFRLEVEGKQVHGSRPDQGLNACRVANELSVAVDRALHAAFPEEDALFTPPVSTFEPTRRAANVPNVNTIPGRERVDFDCRILPSVPLEAVEATIDEEIRRAAERTGARIVRSAIQRVQAPRPTPPDAPVVTLLRDAVEDVLGVKPLVGGVGGGTCAAHFRAAGIPAVVWAKENDSAHMPDEYVEIDDLMAEAKVFARMMLGGAALRG